MGYTILKQAKNGKVKVRLDEVVSGIRHRKQISCFKNEVQSAYRQWLLDLKNSNQGKFRIKDKMPEYRDYLKTNTKPITYNHNRHVLEYVNNNMGHLMIAAVKGVDIDRLLWCLRRDKPHLQKNSINFWLATLGAFFSWCQSKGYYSSLNPCKGKRLKDNDRREVYLAPEEVADLINKAYTVSDRLGLCAELAVKAGMRYTEIKLLEWSDIDFANSRILIPAGRSKNAAADMVYLTSQLVSKLKELKKTITTSRVFIPFNMKHLWIKLQPNLPRAKNGSLLR